jgi:hypothetical protein
MGLIIVRAATVLKRRNSTPATGQSILSYKCRNSVAQTVTTCLVQLAIELQEIVVTMPATEHAVAKLLGHRS